MDCSLLGASVHGILQARILVWVAISFSRGSSQPRNQTQASCIAGRFFTDWATRETQRKHNLLNWEEVPVTHLKYSELFTLEYKWGSLSNSLSYDLQLFTFFSLWKLCYLSTSVLQNSQSELDSEDLAAAITNKSQILYFCRRFPFPSGIMRSVIVFFHCTTYQEPQWIYITLKEKKHSWVVSIFQPVMTIISKREGKCLFLISIWLGHGKELVRIFSQVWFSSRHPSIAYTMCLGFPELWALAMWALNCYSYVLVLRFLIRVFWACSWFTLFVGPEAYTI